ncbi:hypothetical protein PRIPAC_97401 [Pristionchus pacificus]|uniref:Ribosomal protein n=1 Tax=Pristionchus pacificus TaxID=54126 RepID=A0A2A6B325_PRIPA|nr:hypothetical protein PRIPAC_97401 [Pristionchus pacificus]|eukprot:PDM60270.1 ribosomal protein [Pristionchus pacificus]
MSFASRVLLPLLLSSMVSKVTSQRLCGRSLSASGSVIRTALKSLEALKWVDKSEDGKGRILSKQGRKDLDRIAADLRSTAAPAEL